MKTRQDNDVTHRIGEIYAENDNELSLSIKSVAVCFGRSYSFVNAKMKLNCRDLSNVVRLVMKTKQDNDVPNGTDVIYDENETQLS